MSHTRDPLVVEDVVIEDGVPLPKPKVSKRYPFAELQVGQSFLVKNAQRNELGACVSYAAKRFGYKFTTRKEADGIRVWRVA